MSSALLFFILYCLSFLLVLNSNDWVIIWMGLEINMVSFIVIVYKQMSINHIESCLKYFFVQSLGSALLLGLFYFSEKYFSYVGLLIMSYKMGGGVFFFWFPSVCSGLGWWGVFFLATFQSLIPFMLMVLFVSWLLIYFMVISLIVGVVGSFNQSSVKRLLAYSSIHHIGWLMVCVKIDMTLWVYYLMMYGLTIFPIVYLMSKMGVDSVFSLYKCKSKMWLIMVVLSMAGMPPMMGFFLKWVVFYYLLDFSYSIIMILMMVSVVMFYIYIRLMYDVIMGFGVEMGWLKGLKVKMFYLSWDLMSIIGILLGMFGFMVIML